MKFKQIINSFSAWTVDRLTSARRATLTMLATFLIAMTAQTAWAESVSYIDASGNPQNADATEITSASGNNLASGWYVVKGNVTLNHHLNFTGNVNLILADGATLTITGSKVRTVNGSDIYYGLSCESEDGGTKHDLTIYGQLGGTGKISSSGGGNNPTYSYDFFAHNITINGGVVEAKSSSRCIIATEKVTINGGQVSAVNGDIMAQGGDGTITLGWIKGADYIHAMYYKGTIVFAKQFIYWAYHNNGEPIAFATTDKGDNGYLINNYRIMPDVWGVAGGNDGSTAEKACTITNTEGLNHLAQCVNVGEYNQGKYFKLGANISYDHTTDWDDANSTENNFMPIGVGTLSFNNFIGHFDGCNYTISGIRIYNSSNDNQGLFAFPQYSAEIKNIKLADTRIVGNNNVGGIVGKFYQYTINNCHIASNVAIKATNYNCGGIAGYDGNSGSSIIGCTSAATVSGNNYVGGIAGQVFGSITDCFVTGATVSGTSKVGAIVGFKKTDGTLKNNYYYDSKVNGTADATDAGCNGADVAGARKAYKVTLGTYVSMDGTATAHGTVTNGGDISITSYANNSGIMYTTKSGGTTTSTTYAGATETIKLKYTGTVAGGCVVGYSVNSGEATAGNTITMPAADATITKVDMALWGNGDGDSEATAYVITTTAGLDLLAQKVNAGTGYSGKFFKLGADITYDKNTPNNYTPIGIDSYKPFYGTFDGQGHTISGININRSELDAEYQGVFGFIYGTVENLVVSNCSIVARSNVGAIAGCLVTATIENCSVSNNVTLSGNSYVGGIVGASDLGTIKGCVSAAAITGTRDAGIDAYDLGGIVGATLSDSKVTDNLFTGTISDNLNQYIGAIVGGKEYGTLTNNLHTSTVLGGIGAASSKTGADGAGARKAYTVTLSDGVAPSGTPSEYVVSGITVYADNNVILYNNGTTSTYYAGATETIKLKYTGTVAERCGVGYKVNDGEATAGNTITMPAADATITKVDMDLWGNGDGSETNPYVITTTEGLDLLAQDVNGGTSYEGKYFKLGDNIAYDKNTANNFTPIGCRIIIEENSPIERPFRGHFDGNGKTISGINLNNSDVEDHGIFGYLYGTVKNLVVNNCSIVADHNIGAIVGVLYGTIENCHVGSDVTLSGHLHVGGIAGWCADATIKGCTSAATITGKNSSNNNANNLGGIVGATNGPSFLTDNLFTGAITGDLGQYIGAIFGWGNEDATLTNNVHTSAGFGGIGAEGSATGSDGAGARKAVEIIAAEGVTITPTGTKTTYNVSGITAYTDNNFIGYDSKLYAGATQAAKLSITYTVPEGYIFDGIDAGEGVGIVLNEGVYNLAVPASGNVTISAKLKNLTMTLAEIEEFEKLAIDPTMKSYVENGALKLSVTPKNKFWTLACGVDLLLPEGIVVYKARMNSAGTKVDLTEISDSELNGVLKANNGVLIASTPGESYEFKVSPENSVTALSTADAKSYGNDNQLVPVLEETHFDSENYFILTDNQFVMVDVSKDTKVPVGKAVLKVPAGTAQARAFGIDGYDTTGDTTGINAVLENNGEEVWYNLQGQRISKPTRKGIYILNGKKVRM